MIAQVLETAQFSSDDDHGGGGRVLPPYRLQHDRGVVHFNCTGQHIYDLCLHKAAGGRQLLGQIELCSSGWTINYLERQPFHESLNYLSYGAALEAVFAELDQRQRQANRAAFAEV